MGIVAASLAYLDKTVDDVHRANMLLFFLFVIVKGGSALRTPKL
jgi:hypothetical protein